MSLPDEIPTLPPPAGGRIFTTTRRVRWAEGDHENRLRLDAIARYLQDVAGDDNLGLPSPDGMWVIRRTIILVHQPLHFDEVVTLTTFCGGLGARWAERRTSLVGDDGGRVECMGLWIRFNTDTGLPARLSESFLAQYADFSGNRKVDPTLHHGPVPDDADRRPWPLRSTDIDAMRHVNNAAAWEAVEDELARRGLCRGLCEIEHPDAIAPTDEVVLASQVDDGVLRVWLTVDDAVRASAVVRPCP